MSEGPAKRHWFRFSLRTLFFVTTLACVLGYELNWIRQRRELDAKYQALRSEFVDRRGLSFVINHSDFHEPDWITRFQLWLFRENPRVAVLLVFIVDDGCRCLVAN